MLGGGLVGRVMKAVKSDAGEMCVSESVLVLVPCIHSVILKRSEVWGLCLLICNLFSGRFLQIIYGI